MAGRFEELSDLEWQLVADICPPQPTPRGRGMPPPPFRAVLNTLLSVLIIGCRWGDGPAVPTGPRSVPHGRPIKPDVPRFEAERPVCPGPDKVSPCVLQCLAGHRDDP